MKQFFDKITPAESEKIDMLLAEAFYACNISFRTVESKYFLQFVHALRPSYVPPHRRKLAGVLLEKQNIKIDQRNKELVFKMDKQAVLLVDGWTNSNANRHYFVCMLATANDQKMFLESYDISESGESSDHLIELVQKAVDHAKKKYDCEVFAAVSDNAPNMTCTGRLIQPELMFTTCNSHSANLLAKDLIGVQKYGVILAKVMRVQKEFRKPGLDSRLSAAGGNKPVLYSIIRFASTRNAVQSFVDNLPFMKKVCANENDDENDALKNPDPSVSQLLFDVNFVESVKNLLILLNPIAKIINICQKSDVSVADAVEKWLDLLAEAPKELEALVKSRIKKSNVFNKYSLTANYFHPIYRGKKFDESQRKIVNDYVFDVLDSEALESCRLFDSDEGTFGSLKNKTITSPKTYWYFASQQGHQMLASFAMKLSKIPSSTCQLERLFCNWGFIHDETRNRLSPESSKKLLNIYFTLRSTDSIEEEEDEWESFDE